MELRPAIEAVATHLEHSGDAVEGRARGHLGVVRRVLAVALVAAAVQPLILVFV